MTGEVVAAEISKYERARERAKKLGFHDYIEHFENIIRELKEIEELDMKFEEQRTPTSHYF